MCDDGTGDGTDDGQAGSNGVGRSGVGADDGEDDEDAGQARDSLRYYHSNRDMVYESKHTGFGVE